MKRKLLAALLAGVTAFVAVLLEQPGEKPPGVAGGPPVSFGWVNDPAAVRGTRPADHVLDR